MARLSPYLQLLLARKRPIDTATNPPDVGPSYPEQPAPPPVTIGARPANSMGVAPTTNLDPQVDIQPRTASETVQGYDRGLHPDKDIPAMMTPYHRNRGLEVLEGLGNVAASGLGVNLQSILHPRGTDEQRARRALHDEQSIEAVKLQERRVGAEEQRAAADEARAGSYADHLKNIEEQAGIKLNKRDDKEVGGRVLRPRADGSGYDVIYEPPDKPAKEPSGFSLSPGEARYDSEGHLITERAPKPESDSGVDTAPLGELESNFRTNATTAQKAAEDTEKQVKLYIQQQQQLAKDKGTEYDPSKDTNVASMTAEARRQREYAQGQTEKADQVAIKKVEAGSKRKHASNANVNKGQRWSKSQWAAANPQGDPSAAGQAAKVKGFQVVN